MKSESTSEGPRGRSWARYSRPAAGVLVLVLLFAAAEAVARIEQYYKMGSLPTYKPRHLLDFYRFYRVNPEYRSATVRIDAAGFRNDEEVTPEKPNNVVRILTMGGSTVWGEDGHYPSTATIDNSQTIAARLETMLNARAAARQAPFRVQVLNAGVVGYRLYQNLDYFIHRLVEFRPDLVVEIDGHNDLDALVMGVPPYHHRNEAPLERALNHPTLFDVFRFGIKYAEERSLFVRKAYTRLEQMVNGRALERERTQYDNQRPSNAEIEKWLGEYVVTVRQLDASAKIAGARVLFVVQAELAGEREKRLTEQEVKIQRYWAGYTWLHTVVRDRLIARMHEAADQH